MPGNHDTVTIKDGVTVTVSDARVVGLSDGNGTIAIELGHAGALVIASGGILQVRGDIEFGAGGDKPYLTVQGGGVLEFDSSQAANPASTKYKAHPDGNYAFRPFVTAGTSKSRATVRSNAGGGNGYFSLGGFVNDGKYNLSYTDFMRIGDAANPAFSMWSSGTDTQWIAMHNTFTSCGLAPSAAGSLAAGEVFKHDYNVHANSLGAGAFSRGGVSPPIGKGGVREIVGNVFDSAADYGLDGMSFTIHSNYFQSGLGTGNFGTATWAKFENNFYRWAANGGGGGMTALGDVDNNVIFIDNAAPDNPHMISMGWKAPIKVVGNLVECTGDPTTDSGEFVLVNGQLVHKANYAVTNNIILPTTMGHSCNEIMSVQDFIGNPNVGTTFTVDHNTYYGERSTTPPGNNEDAIHMGEALAVQPGALASYRNNIIWNRTPGSSYKYNNAGTPVTDGCAPANCDYNDGWKTKTDGGAFKGGANGYASPFSGKPGAHDLAVDPLFLDSSRSVETFDSAYLGNKAPAWKSDGKYKVGDMVSNADRTVRDGATINYRYVNNGGCSGANPQPGLYTKAARACWEWASLYRLRQGVAAQKLYEDNSIGVYGNDIITTLIQWIRTGFSPSNSALSHAGSDGKDIGAVPVTLPAPSFPATNGAKQ